MRGDECRQETCSSRQTLSRVCSKTHISLNHLSLQSPCYHTHPHTRVCMCTNTHTDAHSSLNSRGQGGPPFWAQPSTCPYPELYHVLLHEFLQRLYNPKDTLPSLITHPRTRARFATRVKYFFPPQVPCDQETDLVLVGFSLRITSMVRTQGFSKSRKKP